MWDGIGSHGVANVERVLRREAEVIAYRFPQVDRELIDRRLGETYDRLAATAAIQTHLVTIAGRLVVEELRHAGRDIAEGGHSPASEEVAAHTA